MSNRLAFVAALALCAASLSAGASGDDWFSRSEHPESRAWQINSYLKGTPAQIGKTLNLELARLTKVCRLNEFNLAGDIKHIEEEKRDITNRVKASAEYKRAEEENQAAHNDLSAAHRQHDSLVEVRASSICNKTKAAMERMLNQALSASDQLRTDEANLKDLMGQTQDAINTLRKAQDWRNEQVNAIWNTTRLRWPLARGNKGILGKVTVDHVFDDGSFSASYEALDWGDEVQNKEELHLTLVEKHPVEVLVFGCGDLHPQAGKPIEIYKTLAVVEAKAGDDDVVYVVKRSPSDFDSLSDAITAPLDVSTPATQP